MDSLVEEAIRSADLSKGLLLAGYPASKAQGDFLVGLRQKYQLPKAVVIHLSLPDDVARKRLANQKHDTEQLLKDYHRELDFVRIYFPQADIRDIDATQEPAAISRAISSILGDTR
jgi:adenylate kinase family enzyme